MKITLDIQRPENLLILASLVSVAGHDEKKSAVQQAMVSHDLSATDHAEEVVTGNPSDFTSGDWQNIYYQLCDATRKHVRTDFEVVPAIKTFKRLKWWSS